MAEKKNHVMIAVVTNLTNSQSAELSAKVTASKNKIAPQSTGTIGITTKDKLGSLLQSSTRKAIGNGKGGKS